MTSLGAEVVGGRVVVECGVDVFREADLPSRGPTCNACVVSS